MRDTARRDAPPATGNRPDLHLRARSALRGVIRDGMEAYVRERMLPRLIPVGPDEIADASRDGRLVILRRLAVALRGERTRGRAGHWSYSLDRHIGLVQAMAAERRAFGAITRAGPT